MERAVLETEAYQMYEGKVSVPELRALVLKHFFTHKKLYIGEDETGHPAPPWRPPGRDGPAWRICRCLCCGISAG